MIPTLLLLLTLGAFAQEDGPAAPTLRSPAVRVVAFEGIRGEQCSASAARAGTCIDRVRISDTGRAWDSPPLPTAFEHTTWRSTAGLYAHMYQDIAYRWNLTDVETTLVATGISSLPRLSDAWSRSGLHRRNHSLPRQETILDRDDWFLPFAAPDADRSQGQVYPLLRYKGNAELDFPAVVVMSGRFAHRMGFNQRAHDYDIMDADPESAGPFHEQFFPFQNAMRASAAGVYRPIELLPLQDFAPRGQKDRKAGGQQVKDPTYARVEEVASRHFVDFQRLVYVQAGQFAMDEFTRNHMRVLAGVAAMATPPAEIERETGLSRDLVAAARWETDTSDEIGLTASDDSAGDLDEAKLRVDALDENVVDAWINILVKDGFSAHLGTLNHNISERLLLGKLRDHETTIAGTARSDRERFVSRRLLGGEDIEAARTVIARETLRLLLDNVTQNQPQRRPEYDTWILLDAARRGIASTFDTETRSTPREVETNATAQWVEVLGKHGWTPTHIPQGAGAVDPIAVCTTKNATEALDEPVFRRVNLDLLVEAPPGLEAAELLWLKGAELPFVMVDNAKLNRPKVKELVRIGGGGNAVYRIRWEVWSGWHLLWWLRPTGENEGTLELRTGAVCDDTAVVGTKLVPSLVRAGLLAGNFRPSVPETSKEARAAAQKARKERGRKDLDSEEVLGNTEESVTKGRDDAAAGRAKIDAAKSAEAGALVEGGAPDLTGALEDVEIGLEDLLPNTDYIRALVHPVIRRQQGKGLLLMVVDLAPPGQHRIYDWWGMKTPYAREGARIRRRQQAPGEADHDERRLQAAGWSWYFHPDIDRPALVFPAYQPTDSVNADSLRPRWGRRKQLDFWANAGVGGFPYRHTLAACQPTSGAVAACEGQTKDGAPATAVLSEGFSADAQALADLWILSRRPTAIEAGIELRLDVVKAGRATVARKLHEFFGRDPANDLAFSWVVRPQAGLLVGARFSPTPGPLWRGGRGRSTWGAPRPDGSTPARRWQWGVRGGLLAGPGVGTTEGTLAIEPWLGWSGRSASSKRASFTPYRPGAYHGVYTRFQRGFPLGATEEGQFLALAHSTTLMIGYRLQLRLSSPYTVPSP